MKEVSKKVKIIIITISIYLDICFKVSRVSRVRRMGTYSYEQRSCFHYQFVPRTPGYVWDNVFIGIASEEICILTHKNNFFLHFCSICSCMKKRLSNDLHIWWLTFIFNWTYQTVFSTGANRKIDMLGHSGTAGWTLGGKQTKGRLDAALTAT